MQTSSRWRRPTLMSLNDSDEATKPPTPVRGQSSGSRTSGTSPKTSVSPLAFVRRWAIRADACPPSRPRGIFPARIQAAACPPAVSAASPGMAVELAAGAVALAVAVGLAAVGLAAVGLAAAVEPAVAAGQAAVAERNA